MLYAIKALCFHYKIWLLRLHLFLGGEVGNGDRKALEWKKLKSKDLGISNSMIARPTRKVLNGLKQRGIMLVLVL